MKTRRSTRAQDPKRAVAYLRVSTTREQQELGLSAQRAAIEAWARREGVEVCAVFEEEISGGASLEKRPVLLRAISALGEHCAGSLIVQRLDRFSRDPLGAAMAEIQVHRLGARVVTADGVGNGDDPGSRLMKDVALAAARFERSMIAARTKAALAVKKTRGESTGTPPYGWRLGEDGKTLVADKAEQETVRRMRALREQGWAYRQIRKEGARRGWTSRAGKAFTLQAVFDLTKDAECTTVDNSDSTRGRGGTGPSCLVGAAVRLPFRAHQTQSSVRSPMFCTSGFEGKCREVCGRYGFVIRNNSCSIESAMSFTVVKPSGAAIVRV